MRSCKDDNPTMGTGKKRGMKVGVLALQGDVSEHVDAFARALQAMGLLDHSRLSLVRDAEEIEDLDVLAIPGGESTTISRLIDKNRMRERILSFDGGIFATCAGMVLMATEVDDPRVNNLGLIDLAVDRNAFGRQRESFEADLEIKDLDSPYHAVFIRAPVATRSGPGVEILSRIDQGIVGVRCGKYYALAFHPELGNDPRVHIQFLERLGF
ncbi:MAG TPA: pyridoxal 5'-phosphate synthase glutaminase subunit PdxT [Methanoregulaceae archaeon]|nr:pyridoxal 5'-phosphate synthase glutaminase subunit PdxT [Methanoregulaceae archaeon]